MIEIKAIRIDVIQFKVIQIKLSKFNWSKFKVFTIWVIKNLLIKIQVITMIISISLRISNMITFNHSWNFDQFDHFSLKHFDYLDQVNTFITVINLISLRKAYMSTFNHIGNSDYFDHININQLNQCYQSGWTKNSN